MVTSQLIQRCIEDHSKAKKELYEGFAPAMFAICCRYAKNHEDAEDIFQQAFIKIFEKLHQIKFYKTSTQQNQGSDYNNIYK